MTHIQNLVLEALPKHQKFMTPIQTKILTLLSSGPMQLEQLEHILGVDDIESPAFVDEQGSADEFNEYTKRIVVIADALKELEDGGLVIEEFDEALGGYVVTKL